MSLTIAHAYLASKNREKDILIFEESTATVPLAAKTLGVISDRIAKSLSFRTKEAVILVVVSGDARIDNKKFKAQFKSKAKMLPLDEVETLIGHDVGGVCPFGVKDDVVIFCDQSLTKHQTVFPACGDDHSAIELTPEDLFSLAQGQAWVDICQQ